MPLPRTIRIAKHTEVPVCTRCHQRPALGVYTWDRKSFGRYKTHNSILCASCGLGIADEVSMYELGDETIFYKPNSNVRISTRFDYEQNIQPHAKTITESSKPAHKLLDTHEGNRIHTYRPVSRVWCEHCDKPVLPIVIRHERVAAKSGKRYVQTTSTCIECDKPVHNPIED